MTTHDGEWTATTKAQQVDALLTYNGELQAEIDVLRSSLADVLHRSAEHVRGCTNQQCCMRVITP